MDLEDKVLNRSSTPIVGFSRESVQAKGKITLTVAITDKQGVTIIVPQEFYVIDAPTKYNCILGRKFTVAITGIPSNHHQTLLFVGRDGRVGRTRGNQKMARSCNVINKASTVPTKEKEKEKDPEQTIEKEKRPNKKIKLSHLHLNSGSVEIDPRPSKDENVKKSTPQMEIDHQEIEEVSLIEGTKKTIRIGKVLNP